MSDATPVRCATHPDVETTLRCGKCGKPICPKCMVTTPVGARCRDCARLYKLPTFRVYGIHYVRAAGAALVTAIIVGIAWGFLRLYTGWFGPILNIAVGYGAGFIISWVTERSVNRKRGAGLALIGALAVVLCFGTAELVYFFRFGHFLSSAYPYIMTIISTVIGIVVAVYRLR
jgi:hypothetical protein